VFGHRSGLRRHRSRAGSPDCTPDPLRAEAVLLLPPYRSNRAFDARTDGRFKIAPTQLSRHRLPDAIVNAVGRTIAKPVGR
jgi:hypothetical protein